MNRSTLNDLYILPGNEVCADCGDKETVWASVNLGILLCPSCASLHRSLGSHISRVRSLKVDLWDQTQVQALQMGGNSKSNSIYEKFLPPFYPRISSQDPVVLKEQWIQAKYVRKEFIHRQEATICSGSSESVIKSGNLWKKRKGSSKYRWTTFLLTKSEETTVLVYGKKDKSGNHDQDRVIPINRLNGQFCPEKLHENGLQLTFFSNGYTQNIFVYSDTGKEIVDWYLAIREAKLHLAQITYTNMMLKDIIPSLTWKFTFEGFLWKSGPNPCSGYSNRYIILDDCNLMELVDPTDSIPKSELFLGDEMEGYSVQPGTPENFKEKEFPFMICTPSETWVFGANREEDRNEWMNHIKRVLCGAADRKPKHNLLGVDLRYEMENKVPKGKRPSISWSRGSFSSNTSRSNRSSVEETFSTPYTTTHGNSTFYLTPNQVINSGK